ncbi:ABC transporter ATP-binding protein [Anaerolineales bacterium HSG24]|nr:ABC transporter ATP-binding protein [Anaerolineales bacterium HSG24]
MNNHPILRMTNIRKTFGTVVALDEVTFTVQPSEIHGLLGGNGAGKTTLMNVLYGLYKPNAGQIELSGQSLAISSPKDAIRQGVGMVHQHFLQVDNFSVLENIIMGMGNVNPMEATAKINTLSKRFGLTVDPQAIIEDLPIGVRQRVEILKALYRGAKILILDEPTTNLTPQEVDNLFESLRFMVKDGMSVVFITHKLREVLSVCDQITVLRKGKTVTTLKRTEASEEAFVKAMVGDEMDIQNSVVFSQGDTDTIAPATEQPPLLQITDLTVQRTNRLPVINQCNLTIQPHEIVGIAGVADNGQKELAETIIGLQTITSGQVRIDEVVVQQNHTNVLLNGQVSYIPEDRMQDGFLPKATVAQNLILGLQRQQPYSNGRFLNWGNIYQTVRQLIAEYNIQTLGPDDVGANLSGGNIQRVLIARAFSFPSKLLVAHNPTQGLDIPSIEFVYSKILAHKTAGMATLLISENLDELLLLCDRIATLYKGEIMGILERPQFDKYQIGRMMSGLRIST